MMQWRDNECFERSFEACMFSCLIASLPLPWPFVSSPSHTLSCLHLTSGSAMNVAYGEEEMKRFLEEATQVSQVRSLLTLCVHDCACETDTSPPYVVQWLFIWRCLYWINIFVKVASLSITDRHSLFRVVLSHLLSINESYQLAELLASVVFASLLYWTPRWLGGSWPLQGPLPGAQIHHTCRAPKQSLLKRLIMCFPQIDRVCSKYLKENMNYFF